MEQPGYTTRYIQQRNDHVVLSLSLSFQLFPTHTRDRDYIQYISSTTHTILCSLYYYIYTRHMNSSLSDSLFLSWRSLEECYRRGLSECCTSTLTQTEEKKRLLLLLLLQEDEPQRLSVCVCVCVCVCVSVCVSLSLARRSVSFDCCWAVPFPFGFRFVHHPSYGTVAVAVFIRCHGTDGWSRESRNELKFWNTSTASADATTTTTNMMRQTQTNKKCIPHTRTHEKSWDLIIFFILFFVWIWNRASRNVTLCELLELALTFLCYCCCCCCFPLPKQMMCVISWSFTHKPKMPLLFDRPCARAPIVVRVKGQHAKRKIPLEQNSHTNEK